MLPDVPEKGLRQELLATGPELVLEESYRIKTQNTLSTAPREVTLRPKSTLNDATT